MRMHAMLTAPLISDLCAQTPVASVPMGRLCGSPARVASAGGAQGMAEASLSPVPKLYISPRTVSLSAVN